MDPRPTEAPAKGGKFGGAEVLVAEHQHRMLGEGALDPTESRVVQRPRQVDAEGFGAERLAERAQFR